MPDRRTFLITGAGRGIGAATAIMAAQRGANVFVNYARNAEAAGRVVEQCRSAGAGAEALAGNVGTEADVIAMFDACRARFGSIDVLVNNAGIVQPLERFENYTVERLTEIVTVNVIGAFLCAREAVREMSTAHGGPGGVVVNVSSVAAYLGSPAEYVDYAATKAAIDAMTIGLAKEVATEGIRVNAVRPGLIDTHIHEGDRLERLYRNIPLQRTGHADEVAEAILWLASEASSYVTGSLLNVSGGR